MTARPRARRRSRPPSALLQLLETRAWFEGSATLAMLPLWRLAPRGDGHHVLVIPGLCASDDSTRILRTFLGTLGYAVSPWNQGRNFGVRPGVLEGIRSTLTRLAAHGRKVSLIGWSLGGLYARELAKEVPDAVRLVITLGSPFAGESNATPASRLYEWVSGCKVGAAEASRELEVSPPVPTTSIWSRSDGVVSWQRSVELPQPLAENIEIRASHCGLGMHPLALFAIADRLAQPEGQWAPFQRDGWRRLAFGDTADAERAALDAET